MKDWLKNEWYTLVSEYSEDDYLINNLWEEIEKKYNHKSRHYHNLTHIYNMLIQFEEFVNDIKDKKSLKFAIWYHDIIYKSTKNNNEEKSAVFSKKRLKQLNFNEKRLEIIQNLIISTKKHELILVDNNDNSIFLDLDLSILGTNWETYKIYIQNIRKEYAIYPDFMYKKGRKKVLQHFLERDTLFFTKKYKTLFEHQAKENLKKEIELL
ncbi:hypothetical protein [uncultured Algibacter sp.]|uniref:HD domain-containing protein n=1 Tax=uncultured Algibacter sp. TaxID=298659 RepID=UPI002629AD6D|nr:hypothetical protein [uncultured Algibacter sp.]